MPADNITRLAERCRQRREGWLGSAQCDSRSEPRDEAARKLKIERKTAYVAIQWGEIPSIRIGRRILVPAVAFNRLLDEGSPQLPEKR
jgi:excisionase family DNA binding protein